MPVIFLLLHSNIILSIELIDLHLLGLLPSETILAAPFIDNEDLRDENSNANN